MYKLQMTLNQELGLQYVIDFHRVKLQMYDLMFF